MRRWPGSSGLRVRRPRARGAGAREAATRSRRSSRSPSPPTSTSSTRRPGTCSTPAASASGRCSSCSPPSSATRAPTGVVPAALVVELTHLATLYHDDVMDEADLRRGAQSANARWDNSVAILTGDFLFARASDIVADLGPDAVRIQAQTFSRLVQGQIRETVGPREGEDPLAHYLSVVADKTGSLIATSARFGARLAGASPEHRADPDRVRRADRHRVPAVRRHHRRRQRDVRLRQDARHGPARGRPDPADADRPARPATRRDARLLELLSGADRPTTPSTPRRSRCCAATRPWSQARAEVERRTDSRPGDCCGTLPDIPARARSGRPLRPGHHPHVLTRPPPELRDSRGGASGRWTATVPPIRGAGRASIRSSPGCAFRLEAVLRAGQLRRRTSRGSYRMAARPPLLVGLTAAALIGLPARDRVRVGHASTTRPLDRRRTTPTSASSTSTTPAATAARPWCAARSSPPRRGSRGRCQAQEGRACSARSRGSSTWRTHRQDYTGSATTRSSGSSRKSRGERHRTRSSYAGNASYCSRPTTPRSSRSTGKF